MTAPADHIKTIREALEAMPHEPHIGKGILRMFCPATHGGDCMCRKGPALAALDALEADVSKSVSDVSGNASANASEPRWDNEMTIKEKADAYDRLMAAADTHRQYAKAHHAASTLILQDYWLVVAGFLSDNVMRVDAALRRLDDTTQ